MAPGKPREPRKEQQWRHWLRLWQQSGLSVRAFCARHGLTQPSFYAWRRTLQQRAAALTPFLPVQVIADPDDTRIDVSRQDRGDPSGGTAPSCPGWLRPGHAPATADYARRGGSPMLSFPSAGLTLFYLEK